MSDSMRSDDPQALLAHAAWVRRLSRSLVLDPGRADDVEQQAWLGALQRPPAHGANLPGWLAQVVRNAARQLGRSEGRRKHREGRASRSTGAPEAPSASEVVAQVELQREVVSTVLELDEPFRTTILLRYWRDQSPQQIAVAQGVPASTVRGRLRRAHEELRERLDRKFRGDRSAWSVALLDWIRASEGASAAGVGGASALLMGGLVMGWKLGLGVAAALAAAVTWYAWPAPPARPASLVAASAPGAEAEVSPPGAPSVAATGERDVARGPAPETARGSAPGASTLLAIHGAVRAPDGSPIPGVALTLYADAEVWGTEDWDAREPLARGVSDATGSFRIEGLGPSDAGFRLRAEAAGFQTGVVRTRRPDERIELALLWLGALSGRVVDAETREPVAGATVVWRQDAPATTDASGAFRIEDVPADVALSFYARAPGYAEVAAQVRLPGPEGSTVAFELQRGAPLVVEVFDAETGLPVADAEVRGDPRVAPFTRTDDEGRFEVRIVDAGDLYVMVRAPGHRSFVWGYRVEDVNRALSPRIPLTPLGTIAGVARRADGEPVVDAGVFVVRDRMGFGGDRLSAEERAALDLPGHAGSDPFEELAGASDAQGAFRVPFAPSPAPQHVVAVLGDGTSARSASFVVEDSRQQPWIEVVFGAGAAVSGRVLVNGAAREGVTVRWRSVGAERSGQAETDAQGRYRLTNVEPGAITLEAFGFDLWAFGPLPSVELTLADGESTEQDLAFEFETAVISGRVVSAADEPLPDVYVQASYESPDVHGTGRFEATTDADGRYALEVRGGQVFDLIARLGLVERRQSDVAAGSEDVDFVFPELGTLRVQLVDAASGEAIQVPPGARSSSLSWRASDGGEFRPIHRAFSSAGCAELELPLGSIDLSVLVADSGYVPRTVSGVPVARDRDAAPVRVALTRGVVAQLALAPAAGAAAGSLGGHLYYLLGEAQLGQLRGPLAEDDPDVNHRINEHRLWIGDPALHAQDFSPDDRGRAHVTGLAPGRYTIRAFPDDLLFEPEWFEVGDEEPDPIEVRWRLR